MLPCFLLRLSSMLVRTSSAMSLKRFCHADQGGVVTVLICAHKAICAYAGIAVQVLAGVGSLGYFTNRHVLLSFWTNLSPSTCAWRLVANEYTDASRIIPSWKTRQRKRP